MINRIISFLITISCLSSCAILYTPPAEPTPFMREKDGIAANANIGTNGSGIFASANVTKPLSDVVCVNVSGAVGLAAVDPYPKNPFPNNKSQSNIAFNLGINTTRLTKYPLMCWIGGQFGRSSDSYEAGFGYPAVSKDSAIVVLDALGNKARYEVLKGNYMGFKIGLTHVLLSNYDNNIKKRDLKKTRFDIMGSPYLNILKYNYKNAFAFNTKFNELLHYSLSINVGKPKWVLGFRADLMQPLVQLTNDLRGIPTDVYHPGFSEIPSVVPSISYTRFLKGKFAR
jgi:hypothetical protein